MTISVFVGTSVDGFIARPNGGLDFLPAGGGEPHGYEEFMASVDALVIGRNTFETVLKFDPWPYGKKRVVVLSSRPVDLSAVRWASSRPAARSSRLLLFCDSTAVVGALCKGRSSSPLLLRRLRQISAFLFAFSLRLHVVWLPSELNPADYPSRNPRQGPFLR